MSLKNQFHAMVHVKIYPLFKHPFFPPMRVPVWLQFNPSDQFDTQNLWDAQFELNERISPGEEREVPISFYMSYEYLMPKLEVGLPFVIWQGPNGKAGEGKIIKLLYDK